MLRLFLDRSGECAAFALAKNGRTICKIAWAGGFMHSPAWFAEMATAINEAGYSVADVDEFICGIGPGSFSGIRSALAALEGMALPGAKPVRGLSGAAVLAFEYASEDCDVITVIGDARRSRLWCVSYRLDRGGCGVKLHRNASLSNTADDFELIKIEELAHKVPAGALIISPDWERVGDFLKESFPRELLVERKLSPDIEVMVRLVSEYPSICRLEPLPVYLHPAVAAKPVLKC